MFVMRQERGKSRASARVSDPRAIEAHGRVRGEPPYPHWAARYSPFGGGNPDLGRRALLAACVLLVHWRVFTVFFAVDDFGFLARAATPATLPAELAHVFSHRYFSAELLYRVCRGLFGTDAGLFHLVTVGLHLLNAELVFLCTRRLVGDRPIAVAASLLFAVHPATYTPVAWLAAGFNELPVLTLALASVLLLDSDVRAPRAWKLAAMTSCMVVAAGFKQHAILMPLYWVGTLACLAMTRRAGPAAWRRLAVCAGLLVPFYVYFRVAVVPEMRGLFAGPYERVFDLPTVAGTLLRYALAAINPVPVLREPLNVQVAWMDPRDVTVLGRVVGASIVAGVVGVILVAPAARAHRRLAAGAAGLLVGWLALPATMPRHVHEYYVYAALPMAAVLTAVAVTSVRGAFAPSIGPRLRTLGWSVAIVLLWVAGEAMHATASIVAQAGRARAIDRALEAVPDGTRVLVVPPSDGAHEDTAFGLSVDALHGHRGIRIQFAAAADPVVTSGAGLQLLAVNRLGERAEVSFVDNAPWADGTPVAFTATDAPASHRIHANAPGLLAIQLPLEVLGRVACTLEWSLVAAQGQAVGEGRLPCRDIAGTFTTLALARRERRLPAGEYALRLKVVGDGVVRLRTSGAVLAHRVIVGPATSALD